MTSPISSGVAASMAFGDTRTGTEPGTLAGDCCGASERHSFLRLGRFSGTPSQQSTCFPGLIIQIRPERTDPDDESLLRIVRCLYHRLGLFRQFRQ